MSSSVQVVNTESPVNTSLIRVTDFNTKRKITGVIADNLVVPTPSSLSKIKIVNYVNPDTSIAIHIIFENVDANSLGASFRLVKDGATKDIDITKRRFDTIAACYTTYEQLIDWYHQDGSLHYELRLFFPTVSVNTVEDNLISNRRLLDAFERKVGADVKLIIDGQTIDVSKFILVTQSRVFEALFNSDMTDSADSVIRIEDIKYDTMLQLVKNMYSGQVAPVDTMAALELFCASDKYEVDKITAQLIAYLKDNLTNDNVLLVLREADLRNCSPLRQSCLDHIVSCQSCDITQLVGFDKLDRHQCLQIIKYLCLSRKHLEQ
ncbi:BTB and MATH domain-containing protein 43 [Halotydeus destructor]|nr:BTB and MATH domain-containing protein 43 [Halotydeus destructor]